MSTKTGVSTGANEHSIADDVDAREVVFDDESDAEYDEVTEEVEVTDDEDGGAGASSGPPSKETVNPHREVKPSGAGGKAKAPGKVVPSDKVREMAMGSPSARPGVAKASLLKDRDPFPTFGDWTPETMSQIEISFPTLTGKNETTNELTRDTRPEARYWKGPITFKFGNYVSDTLRINNVTIPYHTGKGYGSTYVYMCLPGFIGSCFSEAGKRRAPTKVNETSLAPDAERWWKIANKVEDIFGVIDHNTRKFHPKSLETIFDSTANGLVCSVVLKFYCKAATTEKEALRPTTPRTVAVEVCRGYIATLDMNVQMPTRISRDKPKREPMASTADVANDSLMKRLAELGL